MRKFYQLDRSRPEYVYRYSGPTEEHSQGDSFEKKEEDNETKMQMVTLAESEEPEDNECILLDTKTMVPTVYRLVAAHCKAPWGERSPAHAGAARIATGMPIPPELEDRCHIFDYGTEHNFPVPYHAENMAVPHGIPIPQELEDRCHLVDRTWQLLMTGGADTVQDAHLDKEWDLI